MVMMPSSSRSTLLLPALWNVSCILWLLTTSQPVAADCLSDPEINSIFEDVVGKPKTIPRYGSCCMFDVCGLQCPESLPEPEKGYGIVVIFFILVSFVVGVGTYFFIEGSTENFFVAGRSLPFFIIVMTLASQSIDSNCMLGNADLSYKYSFWDGAVLPIGLALSLIINGFTLAERIHGENVLTLPDIFAKRYGKIVELLVSISTVISFIMLLAGNLVGMGVIVAYLWGIEESGAIWISSAIVWAYTVSGGLFSVAYTDVLQGAIGWIGILSFAFWLLASESPKAPPPSIGYPGYIYPDQVGDGGICDMYEGVPCTSDDPTTCCYNEDLWCPNGLPHCDRYDRGFYPLGDQQVYPGQMTDALALSPFPNAILWNWATIFILGFGNLAALDFQVRCMASKTPKIAKYGCITAGCITLLIGIPFSFLGSVTRKYYGPDAPSSQFVVDSCSSILLQPTCAEWSPDPVAFLRLATNHAPPILGGWCLLGIVAASMSTADGAILALGTVMANNIFRQIDTIYPKFVNPDNLLLFARISTLPLTLIATGIGAFYRDLDHAAGATGYLLIVAFDIVFATVVVPLFGAFYTKNPSPRAALLSIVGGALTRIIMEFSMPNDGNLLLPFKYPEFLGYGTAASALPPPFVNATDVWDPSVEQCDQDTFKDFTGVASLVAPLVSLFLFVTVQFLEHIIQGPLFFFPGGTGYEKNLTEEDQKPQNWTQAVRILFVVIGVIFLVFTIFVVLLVNAL